MANHDPKSFIAAAREVGFTGIGTYPQSNFIHIDIGPARGWAEPFRIGPRDLHPTGLRRAKSWLTAAA